MGNKYTILNILELAKDYLDRYDIANPRLDAERIIADFYKMSNRLDLYLRFDQPVEESEINSIREILKQRSRHKPLQYITGKVEFYGAEITVDQRVLIPRPDSEILVEMVLAKMNRDHKYRILDIGTGSGCLPIAIAKNNSNCEFVAIDLSKEAIAVAEENIKKHSLTDRVFLYQKDIFKLTKVKEQFDIVISNPPYISKQDYLSLSKEVKDFEPRMALTDENDGLEFYRKILEILPVILKKEGCFFLEIGYDLEQKLQNLLENYSYQYSFCKDYHNEDRVLWGSLGKK